MSFFPKPSSPSGALRDLFAFMRQRSREQVIGAALALLVTAIIVIEFVVDPQIGTEPEPEVVQVDIYAPNRTDAEIAADQKKDQAEREAQKKADQEQYNQLAKQLGID
ncbi:MAG: hypothetical protein ACM3ZV_00545 [Bacillota bacterium]